MLTSPGFLWMLMVLRVFAAATWPHAPAVAAALVHSHRLCVSVSVATRGLFNQVNTS